ncbi:ricin-type beta-trefoil lectin domain protein [Vibrio hyugaensis]|uniref:ricin-type beta-trefoil lectin domain protein n=1 Tax=Vibrio hyugaensis TaxID=1534743 RepID=UPI0005EDFBDB|nr:ricin-type beta-trefoil lectin domain protein [Vibrio hyugaensis]
MKKFLTKSAVLLAVISPIAYSADNANLAEVMLSSPLDDSRGYCLDIAGGKGANAPVERGLQAHTCYNYIGEILEDQGFEVSLISSGSFKISYFDVCMSASAIEAGASLDLEECKASDNQSFSLKGNGQISPNSNPSLCITVDSENKREGRGGSPVHVMRPVSLQLCDNSESDYQHWIIKSL